MVLNLDGREPRKKGTMVLRRASLRSPRDSWKKGAVVLQLRPKSHSESGKVCRRKNGLDMANEEK